jgi:cyclophilin family peptidyl-prolyl cis-trans isomerase/HEAT repeat protein
MRRHGAKWLPATLVLVAVLGGENCKTVVVLPPAVPAPIVSADRKVGWVLRLEQQRTLRDTDVVAASRSVTAARASTFAPASTPDLEALALDPEPAIRRRAVLAIGRVGMNEGLPALTSALEDPDADVRAAAAFALGLLGATDPSDATAPAGRAPFAGLVALRAAVNDSSMTVRGRAIEALGLIGDPSTGSLISTASIGCAPLLAPLQSDDEEWPKSPEIEACRLALFALVRLKDYDGLARLALDASGAPVSRWWPIGYALQRINDPRAADALAALVTTPGIDTALFALRGLSQLKDPRVVPIARALAARRDADIKLRISAVRALGQVGGAGAAAALLPIVNDASAPTTLTVEAITALGALADPAQFTALVDRLGDPAPAIRAAALAAAAKSDPEGFMLVLSGLERDREWSVRAALVAVLATLPPARVTPAIGDFTVDPDARVHGPALEALAAVKAPNLTAKAFAALDADDFVERATAAGIIGDTKPEGGVPRLVAAYARSQSDSTYVARGAILGALAKYGNDEAKATLRLGLADREWPVRARAAQLLTGLGEPGVAPERPAPLRHPEDFFESAAVLRPQYSPHAFIDTSAGSIEIELDVVSSPITAHTFIEQARAGFFAGVKFHRVVPTFVIQAGDPRGDGNGGPGYTIADELGMTAYLRGTVGLAIDWRDTGGSQWFIALSPQPHLDSRYTAFGRVVGGWDVIDRVAAWDVIERVRIWDGIEFK